MFAVLFKSRSSVLILTFLFVSRSYSDRQPNETQSYRENKIVSLGLDTTQRQHLHNASTHHQVVFNAELLYIV